MSKHLDRLRRFAEEYPDRHNAANLEAYKDIQASVIHMDDQRQASYEQTIDHVTASRQAQESEADRLRRTIAQHKARLTEFE